MPVWQNGSAEAPSCPHFRHQHVTDGRPGGGPDSLALPPIGPFLTRARADARLGKACFSDHHSEGPMGPEYAVRSLRTLSRESARMEPLLLLLGPEARLELLLHGLGCHNARSHSSTPRVPVAPSHKIGRRAFSIVHRTLSQDDSRKRSWRNTIVFFLQYLRRHLHYSRRAACVINDRVLPQFTIHFKTNLSS